MIIFVLDWVVSVFMLKQKGVEIFIMGNKDKKKNSSIQLAIQDTVERPISRFHLQHIIGPNGWHGWRPQLE